MKRYAYLKDPEHSFFTQQHASEDGNRIKIQRTMDSFLSVARCPLCQTPLSARLGRHGPYFHCACHRE